MKKHKLSFHTKLFLVMLTVSIVPAVLITAFATLNTYGTLYRQMVTVNQDGTLWSQDRLQQYSDTIKNTFYSIESDSSFKSAVMRWSKNDETQQDSSIMRGTLSVQLNQNSEFSSIQLFLTADNSLMKAERAGVRWEQNGWQKAFDRNTELQSNLYYKKGNDGLYAIHTINKFEDRNTVARMAVRLQNSDLSTILSKLQGYDDNGVYLLNDENEILMAAGPAQDKKVLDRAMEQLSVGKTQDGYFALDDNMIFYGKTDSERLSIIKVVPKKEITKAIMPTVYLALLVGILSVLGAVGLSALLSLWVSRPIIRLSERVKHIPMETLEMPGGGEETRDEVSVLENHITRFVDRIRELIHEEYDTKLQAKNAQINALQAQINPHFLFNTLQLMGSIAYSKNVYEVNRIAEALSDIMRFSMNYDGEFVTLNEELHHLDSYFFIQKQRFYDKFTVELVVDEKVGQCRIPKLLIQPIVENSFEHGFEKCTDPWRLTLMAFLNDNGKIHIIIRDSGVGMNSEQLTALREKLSHSQVTGLTASEHIGLMNVNARIKLNFSENDGLQIESAPGKGTKVTLIFDAQWRNS